MKLLCRKIGRFEIRVYEMYDNFANDVILSKWKFSF